MAGGKGKSSGGKSSGGKTSAAEGPKKQQSHSARAGLQVRSDHIVNFHNHGPAAASTPSSIPLYDDPLRCIPKDACHPPFLELIPCLCASLYTGGKTRRFRLWPNQNRFARIGLTATIIREGSYECGSKWLIMRYALGCTRRDRSCCAALNSNRRTIQCRLTLSLS